MYCYSCDGKLGDFFELNGHQFCESCLESEVESMEEIAGENMKLDCGHEIEAEEYYYTDKKHTSCRDCLEEEIERHDKDYNPFEH